MRLQVTCGRPMNHGVCSMTAGETGPADTFVSNAAEADSRVPSG